jgi:hypothetical protein
METSQIEKPGKESIRQGMAHFSNAVGVGSNEGGDKSEKEEYEMPYDQLSSYWQEKLVKDERTQKEHKY